MDLTGVLSNHELQGSLARLAGKLAAVRAAGGPRRQPESRRQRPRRPGWVLKAVVQVLSDGGEPMRATDIHAAVEALVGEPVKWSSIRTALASNVSGSSRRFVRIARGRYTLAYPASLADPSGRRVSAWRFEAGFRLATASMRMLRLRARATNSPSFAFLLAGGRSAHRRTGAGGVNLSYPGNARTSSYRVPGTRLRSPSEVAAHPTATYPTAS